MVVGRSGRAALQLVACAALVAAVAVVLAPGAKANAIINDGTIRLGVTDEGALGFDVGTASKTCTTNANLATATFMRWMPIAASQSGQEDEAGDCDLEGEGWAVGYDGSGYYDATTAGWAGWDFNNPCVCYVTSGVSGTTFSATPSTAKSITNVGDLTVTQQYSPHPGMPQVYDNLITVHNNANVAHDNLRYRRMMNWGDPVVGCDLTYVEFSRMDLTQPAPDSLFDSYTAKAGTLNPNVPLSANGNAGMAGPPTADIRQDDNSWAYDDQAGTWDFDFGTIAPGADRTFTLYYGGDTSYDKVIQDLGPSGLNVQVYDLSVRDPTATDGTACVSVNGGPGDGSPVTFFMAFGHVDIVTPPPPPPVVPPTPPKPTAKFTEVQSPCPDHIVTFTDASLAGGAGTQIVAWSWDFGDGQTGTDPSPTHTYTTPGNYLVTLDVTQANNPNPYAAGPAQSHAKASIVISVPECTTPPTPPPHNVPPIMGQPPLLRIEAGTMACFSVSAMDPDNDLTFISLATGPVGATFNKESNQFCWTPAKGTAGTYCGIVFRVDTYLWDWPQPDWMSVGPNHDPPVTTMSDAKSTCILVWERDVDSDKDGVQDYSDDCPGYPDKLQSDVDGDGLGDVCDPRPCVGSDGQTVVTKQGVCAAKPSAAKPPSSLPGDVDGDGIPDARDDCPDTPDPLQHDMDGDHVGDACDLDIDGDGIQNAALGDPHALLDNCPEVPNADQRDSVGDGVGDACRAHAAPPSSKLTAKGTAQPVPRKADSVQALAALAVLAAVVVAVRRRA